MEKLIKETIEAILNDAGIKINRIILFGSRVRGNYRKDSDWDLLVVVEKKLTREEKRRIGHLIRRRLAEQLIPCDILIRSLDEVEERKEEIGNIIKTALSEGVVI